MKSEYAGSFLRATYFPLRFDLARSSAIRESFFHLLRSVRSASASCRRAR
jgi:hypothetical protein